MTGRTFTLFACAHLSACAGPGVPAPEVAPTPVVEPAAMPEAQIADEPTDPTLSVEDELGMFSRDAAGPLGVRLTLPSGAASLEFMAMPSTDVASPRASLARLCVAHAPGTTIGRTRHTIDDDWAEFSYEGYREGDEVRGACRVFRLPDSPEYTVLMRGEWRPAVDDMMHRRIDAMTPTLRVIVD